MEEGAGPGSRWSQGGRPLPLAGLSRGCHSGGDGGEDYLTKQMLEALRCSL